MFIYLMVSKFLYLLMDYSANQWAGFYMIGTSVLKELIALHALKQVRGVIMHSNIHDGTFDKCS